ncbi:MAG TPA: hypothetical protein VIJ28_17465 [Chloroflexota bacterium]|jgi:uncharacterized membrane protein YeaQ/YmgE (transglycosylase-associated protein family)
MGALDVLSWMAGGLIAGALIGAVSPGRALVDRLAVALAGLFGGYAGGAEIASFTNLNAVAFLGAVCAAVGASGSLAYLLWRRGATRFHD